VHPAIHTSDVLINPHLRNWTSPDRLNAARLAFIPLHIHRSALAID
jgi:hypothetical protein